MFGNGCIWADFEVCAVVSFKLSQMVAASYMAKRVSKKPDRLRAARDCARLAGQFSVFEDFLSVGQGLNAKNQKARRFRPGRMANRHQTG